MEPLATKPTEKTPSHSIIKEVPESIPPNNDILPTAYVTNPFMTKHSKSLTDKNKMLSHPENPQRLTSITSKLQESGILNHCLNITNFDPCSPDLITRLHGEEYYKKVSNYKPDPECGKESIEHGDCYINEHTIKSARIAAEAVKICVDKVLLGDCKNGFAAVRPPGHHADSHGDASGFCFFNNVAMAVRHAQAVHGVRKVLIFDWDAHHGDSTQSKFYSDPDVLFISFHRYDNGMFYPGVEGGKEYLGEGLGQGFNLNLPWNVAENYDYKVGIKILNKMTGLTFLGCGGC